MPPPRKLRIIRAFTLAEILITLGIIGVVAAITIPNLIQNYKQKVYSAKLKKMYSTFINALEASQAENGELKTWSMPNAPDNKEFFDKYLKPYFESINIKYFSNSIKMYLKDGTYFEFNSANGVVYIIMDLNGEKKPNEYGRDRFQVYIHNLYYTTTQNHVDVYTPSVTSRKKKAELCKKNPRENCMALLYKFDNLEFTDAYPIKL